jgi:hypothetical protein
VKSRRWLAICGVLIAAGASLAALQRGPAAIPRLPDGKPNLQGIWQVTSQAIQTDIQPFVEGREIPYKPEAAQKRRENFAKRQTLDPLNSCYMPGVPRIMYVSYPFQIFQAKDHVAFTFEWSSVFRLIYTTALTPRHQGVDSWMGDSRGRWEGDTFVVEVIGNNDRAWFDQAGNHHSDKMRLTERYTLANPDTLQYEVTVTDPQTFTRPWKLSAALGRIKDKQRVLEYQCQAEKEEKNGDFEREPRTWYPK